MIEGVYQNLGPKTLLVFIIKRSTASFTFIVLIIAAFVIKYITVSTGLLRLVSAFNSATIFNTVFNTVIPVGFACLGISIPLSYFIAHLEYARFKVMIGADTFNIIRGVLTKEEISLPYRRIESVDIRQSFIHQIFGVSRLAIEVITDREEGGDKKKNNSDEVLPVIDSKLALEIQAELTKRANVQKFSN